MHLTTEQLAGRYWVFAWDRYYPEGGLNDLRVATDSLEFARDCMISYVNDQWFDGDVYILDTETKEIIR